MTLPNRYYLWILSRYPKLEEFTYRKMIARADELGFDTAQLLRVAHNLSDK